MDNGLDSPGISLVDRAKAIILKPKDEWPKIEAEQKSTGDILRSYVLPLAAIGPVAALLGGQIFGYGGFGFSFPPSLISGISTALISYALGIVAIFVMAFIADWLAPKFDGQSNRANAFRLVAYSYTAAWLAGIFGLIPSLAFFGLLGLYSIYLLYTGAAPLMKVPQEKAVGYTGVTLLVAIVLAVIIAPVTGVIAGLFGATGGGMASRDSGSFDSGSISIPGIGTIDTGKIEEAAERAKKVQSGEIKAVPTETLKALLPDRIGPFERTGFSTQTFGKVGAGVEGTYKAAGATPDQKYQFDLRIRDMLALSGIAGIGAAMGIEQTSEDENGYKRIGTVDGQWREERWRNTSNSGTYATLVSDRFRVEASGRVPDMDVLKSAVAAIDEGDLEDLADD
ncbi:MAG: YIP1 family protein [Sphingomonadaceae bacterium]|nr:YIP1 family protein [Sphingomonadaceae bacterium]